MSKEKFKTIGEGELKHYAKKYRKKITYEINPTANNVSDVKTSFADWLKKVPFTKGFPSIKIDGDTLLYRYDEKPTIYYDLKKGTFKVTECDFNTFGKEICNNQSNYLRGNLQKFSDEKSSINNEQYMKSKIVNEWSSEDHNLWQG